MIRTLTLRLDLWWSLFQRKALRKITWLRDLIARRRPRPIRRWGLLWVSSNRLDGPTRHLICDHQMPVMFRTRREARDFARARYGYIDRRTDLQIEPHGWQRPRPVKITVAQDDGWQRRARG